MKRDRAEYEGEDDEPVPYEEEDDYEEEIPIEIKRPKRGENEILNYIKEAIRHHASHSGTSQKKIVKHLETENKITDPDEVKDALKAGVASGDLVKVKASFMVKGEVYEDKSDKVHIEDIIEGSGNGVVEGDTVTIQYVGTLQASGAKFDEGPAFAFNVGGGEVIKGMDSGVRGMKVGGKRKLTIPSSLGYGKRGHGRMIPPESVLIFEIILTNIE